MEIKEIKINCPEGFEIDKENSTFECIKFKPIKKKLPKTWEEYCKTHPKREGESWIGGGSTIERVHVLKDTSRCYIGDANLLPDKKYAEAMLALCQLIQLRDCYNDGWVPDWNTSQSKYTIYSYRNIPTTAYTSSNNRILTFKTAELRDQFLENFKDLIETAKPLL